MFCSWFWEKKQKETPTQDETIVEQPTTTSLAEYLQSIRIPGGNEMTVGGRRCPAHEDADGFAQALMLYLS